MVIIALLITLLVENLQFIAKLQELFKLAINKLAKLISQITPRNQIQIRYLYLLTCVSILLVALIIKVMFNYYFFIILLFNLITCILTIKVLKWRDISDNNHINSRGAIYAREFFVPLFWFLITPLGAGAICYLAINQLNDELKKKVTDSMVYDITIDRVLFYINLVPYSLLYILIAVAGNFEEVSHYLIAQKKFHNKSFYFLNNLLEEVILIASNQPYTVKNQYTTSESNTIIVDNAKSVATLHRCSLFFVGIIGLITLTSLFH